MAPVAPPLPDSGHSLTAVGKEVICFGGLAEATTQRPSGTVRPQTAPLRTAQARPHATSGLVPSNQLFAYNPDNSTWRPLAPQADGDARGPEARSSHAACMLSATSMLVLGGTGSRHEKLRDCWRLDLADSESKTSEVLELTLDAVTPEQAAALASVAQAAAAAPPEDGGDPVAPPKPKPVFDQSRVAACLAGAIGGGLPSGIFPHHPNELRGVSPAARRAEDDREDLRARSGRVGWVRRGGGEFGGRVGRG